MRSLPRIVLLAQLLVCSPATFADDAGQPLSALQDELGKEDPAKLALEAREHGDPLRGAIVFYQPSLSCAKCHEDQEDGKELGPDLTNPDEGSDDAHYVTSVLSPSAKIKAGFETQQVITNDGEVLTGVLSERNDDVVVLRDLAADGKVHTIDAGKIDEHTVSDASMMPEGMAALLSDRQQFLDLVRYLIEIAQHGPERMAELRAEVAPYVTQPLPEYEKSIDHAGMIGDLNDESFKRGKAIYNRLCVNCHGTHHRPGSLPTSLRFATDKFRHGGDPYRMYQTLTNGFGMMAPQAWMVPEQKYDVIHYIREAYLKDHNPSQYAVVDRLYLDSLPKGTTRGPKPIKMEPWRTMDYGRSLMASYEVGDDGSNFAYKGIAVRLDPGAGGVSRGRYWALYDHDTMRLAAAWSGNGFIDWNGINFNDRHAVHPRIDGEIHLANSIGPGWANPQSGDFDDPRLRGHDGRAYGPLPREWARFRGLYHHGDQVLISYSVGETAVLEMPGIDFIGNDANRPVFTRTLEIDQSQHDLLMRVANDEVSVALVGAGKASLRQQASATLLYIPANATPTTIQVLCSRDSLDALQTHASHLSPPAPLQPLTNGGPRRWAHDLNTTALIGADDKPFAVDVLTRPAQNPWLCRLRMTGLDFFPDGRRAAVSTWDGSVWTVEGINRPADGLIWRRIASGLFQPLGLKIVDGRIYVGCRDQICILHDNNDDGEIDFYECFNSDHQVTEHFHEFAMGLQTDQAGNFYYAKSARHALPALVPHHGTLLRVLADGSQTDIVATGFRAANGVCVNDDGTFFVTDQEGHWTPKNRINWVTEGGFYGNMMGFHDVTDTADAAMQPPLCWITNRFDRSPAELIRVPDSTWGPLRGALLHLSYGYGKVFIVPHENIDGQMQGGMCALPVPSFPTGVMRGRFHPADGQLYLCGMFAWSSTQTQPGGLYRLRYTGKAVNLPVGLAAKRDGLAITFSDPLEKEEAENVSGYRIKTWHIRRSARYGSKHENEKRLEVASAQLSEDQMTVLLELPVIQPTRGMEVRYSLRSENGEPIKGVIHNTVHKLGD